MLVPVDGPSVLCTDSRYAGTAERECDDLDLVIERGVETVLVGRALAAGARTIAFEDREMTVQRHDALVTVDGHSAVEFQRAFVLVPLGGAIDDLRVVKDESELALLAKACEITGEAFTAALGQLRPGVSEHDYAVALERAMVDLGADGPAFGSIVASGPNGAIPHHVPGHRRFASGDLVTIDCGAKFAGYHADMTRTVSIGEPAPWQRAIYDIVALAQEVGIAVAAAGADVADVDAAARDLIESAGYGGNFTHGLGHGVGLEIHEAPWLGQGKTGTLADRVPITIEPGIYLAGTGGVRIEDTLVVRAGTPMAGSAQALTTVTRELLVL